MAELTVSGGYLNYSTDNPISIPLSLLKLCKITKCYNADEPLRDYVALASTQVIDTTSGQSEIKIYPTVSYPTINDVSNFIKSIVGEYDGDGGSYAQRIVTSGSDTFIAKAVAGSSISDNVWQAKKIDSQGNVTWANGNADFTNEAINVSALTYS